MIYSEVSSFSGLKQYWGSYAKLEEKHQYFRSFILNKTAVPQMLLNSTERLSLKLLIEIS